MGKPNTQEKELQNNKVFVLHTATVAQSPKKTPGIGMCVVRSGPPGPPHSISVHTTIGRLQKL